MPTLQHHISNIATVADSAVEIIAHPAAITGTVTTLISYPWWANALNGVHDAAAFAMPILGCIVGMFQLAAIAWRLYRGK